MYRVAICDDNPFAVEYVNKIITAHFENEFKIYKYENPSVMELYIEDVLKGELDVLIIDIDLGRDNGIRVADRLKTKYPEIRIIFISGDIHYAGDIFETKPIYFVVKPISETKLVSAVRLALQDIESSSRELLSINTKSTLIKISIRNIKYIESRKRVAVIVEENIEREVYEKLDTIMKLLPDKFCQCHQSYIVNMDYVHQLDKFEFVLFCGARLPISQSKYYDVKKIFMKYLGDSI